jgi:anti-sigma B factor antagonist
MTLEFSVSGDGDRFCVVSVAGEIDVASAPSLAAKLEEVVDRGRVEIVLDLSEVTFLDSSGLAVLVKYLKRVLPAGGQIRLVVTNRAVRQAIEITHLDTVFAVYDDLDAALA